MEKESKHDEDAESRLSRAVEFIRKSATESSAIPDEAERKPAATVVDHVNHLSADDDTTTTTRVPHRPNDETATTATLLKSSKPVSVNQQHQR